MTCKSSFLACCIVTVLSVAASLTPVKSQAKNGITIWNHAYQENYESDTLDMISSRAENAYILIDPFKDDFMQRPALVQKLAARGNQFAAYISVGTGEDWRSDFAKLRPSLVPHQWDEWEGEYFISTPSDAVLDVMKARIDKIASLGFEWIEFDNMDWAFDTAYREKYDVKLSAEQAVNYFNTLCAYVHSKHMKCMAKNTVEGASMFDGVTYESYVKEMNWWDADGAKDFLTAGKIVIIVHYNEDDCSKRFDEYRGIYGAGISFLCENPDRAGYIHF